MSTEENKALARRVLEEMFNKGTLDLADEVFAPDYVDHDPAMPKDIRAPEGFKEYVSMFRTAFSVTPPGAWFPMMLLPSSAAMSTA